jgi:hypothetical protein
MDAQSKATTLGLSLLVTGAALRLDEDTEGGPPRPGCWWPPESAHWQLQSVHRWPPPRVKNPTSPEDALGDIARRWGPPPAGCGLSVTCVRSSVKALVAESSGPQALVKVERPERSEDE